jgi:hypothetical protein
MATITSAAATNWDLTSTWVGAVVPVNGDTVIINHAVIINVDITGITFSASSAASAVLSTARTMTNITTSAGRGTGVITVTGTVASDVIAVSGVMNTTGLVGTTLIRFNSPCKFQTAITSNSTGSAENYIFDFNAAVEFSGTITYSAATVGVLAINRVVGGTYDITGIFSGATTSNTDSALIIRPLQPITGKFRGVWTSVGAPCIYALTSTISRSGVWNESTGWNAVVVKNDRVINGESLRVNKLNDSAVQTPLRTADLLTGYPAISDVEQGIIYGPSNEFTGTLVPVVIDTAQLATDLLTEMNTSNLTIAQGLRDGMGASAAAIAAVGSINVIP